MVWSFPGEDCFFPSLAVQRLDTNFAYLLNAIVLLLITIKTTTYLLYSGFTSVLSLCKLLELKDFMDKIKMAISSSVRHNLFKVLSFFPILKTNKEDKTVPHYTAVVVGVCYGVQEGLTFPASLSY